MCRSLRKWEGSRFWVNHLVYAADSASSKHLQFHYLQGEFSYSTRGLLHNPERFRCNPWRLWHIPEGLRCNPKLLRHNPEGLERILNGLRCNPLRLRHNPEGLERIPNGLQCNPERLWQNPEGLHPNHN